MPNITVFDTTAHHIRLFALVLTATGVQHKIRAILDTGAPATEFSDQFLRYAGLLADQQDSITIKPGLQTQKYGRIKIPHITICGHALESFPVYVSHYEKSWGVDALIGLDFFRCFCVTIDYSRGEILTAPHQAGNGAIV